MVYLSFWDQGLPGHDFLITDDRSTRAKPDYANKLKGFVCITPTNILLGRRSHMAKLKINVAF